MLELGDISANRQVPVKDKATTTTEQCRSRETARHRGSLHKQGLCPKDVVGEGVTSCLSAHCPAGAFSNSAECREIIG